MMGRLNARIGACLARLAAAALAAACAACSSPAAQLQQHHLKFESLRASAAAIARAWLRGDTSPRYTTAALQQTFTLVEQQRQQLASSPPLLVDPDGAALSQSSERLARDVAAMLRDVRAADRAALAQHAERLTVPPAELR
jgi:hypothetical protein